MLKNFFKTALFEREREERLDVHKSCSLSCWIKESREFFLIHSIKEIVIMKSVTKNPEDADPAITSELHAPLLMH